MARISEEAKLAEARLLLENNGYTVTKKGYFRCLSTNRELSVKQGNFYQNNNPMYAGCIANTDDGKIQLLPFSKTKIEEMYKELAINTKNNEKLAMYKLSMMLGLPWNESLWQMADESKSVSWKIYIGKMNSLPQYSSLTLSDSEPYVGKIDSTIDDDAQIVDELKMKKREKKEALKRWGTSWNESELARLEDFYHDMKAMNKIDTPQDEDYLKKLARLSVKVDLAIEADESSKAKQLGDLYSKYMSDSQFRAMDMTDADKQGGIRTFSQIYAEVESEDFIPPWEKYAKFLNVPQDIVDKTIMHLENFTLRFNNAERMTTPPDDTPKVKGDDNV